MNVLILAAGAIPTNPDDTSGPLCLTEFGNKTLIQLVYEAVLPLQPKAIIPAFREHDIRRYHLDNIAKLLSEKSHIVKVQNQTQGAACTALLASDLIEPDEELLVINGNDLINIDFNDVIEGFRSKKLDAGTIIFDSIHPRYSYVRLGNDQLVVEAAEKKPISRNATAGFYWFKKGSDFLNSVMDMIRKGAAVNGQYYICPAFNEMLLKQKRVGVHALTKDQYHPLKSEKQIEQYETSIDREARK